MTFLNECILRLRTGSLISCDILATEYQDRYVIIMTGTSGTFFLNTVDFYKKLYLFIFFFFESQSNRERETEIFSLLFHSPDSHSSLDLAAKSGARTAFRSPMWEPSSALPRVHVCRKPNPRWSREQGHSDPGSKHSYQCPNCCVSVPTPAYSFSSFQETTLTQKS